MLLVYCIIYCIINYSCVSQNLESLLFHFIFVVVEKGCPVAQAELKLTVELNLIRLLSFCLHLLNAGMLVWATMPRFMGSWCFVPARQELYQQS